MKSIISYFLYYLSQMPEEDYKDESGFQLIKYDSVAGCQDIKIASVVKFENIFCRYFMAWAA